MQYMSVNCDSCKTQCSVNERETSVGFSRTIDNILVLNVRIFIKRRRCAHRMFIYNDGFSTIHRHTMAQVFWYPRSTGRYVTFVPITLYKYNIEFKIIQLMNQDIIDFTKTVETRDNVINSNIILV